MSGYREMQKQCAEAQAEDGNIDKICGLKLALVIILILFSFFMFLIGTFATCLWIYDTVTEPPRVVSQEVKALMKYHGIEVAYCGWDNVCYFYRNGRKVKL